jgi:hypothetical protein
VILTVILMTRPLPVYLQRDCISNPHTGDPMAQRYLMQLQHLSQFFRHRMNRPRLRHPARIRQVILSTNQWATLGVGAVAGSMRKAEAPNACSSCHRCFHLIAALSRQKIENIGVTLFDN